MNRLHRPWGFWWDTWSFGVLGLNQTSGMLYQVCEVKVMPWRIDFRLEIVVTIIGKMLVPLGGALAVSAPSRSPLEGGIPNKCRLYKVYMGLIIRVPSQGYHHFPYETSQVLMEANICA